MTITSKIEICNMAMSHLGNFGTVEDIDTPTTKKEKHFALWYDVSREYALKLLMPNFALTRRLIGKRESTPPFGYSFSYPYPGDCLKILGFGDIDEKDLSYNVEADEFGVVEIQTDEDFTNGMQLRFIRNITDVTRFGPEFKIGLSHILAVNVALPITQDVNKANALKAELPMKLSEISGLNAQENPPVRRSESKFKQARRVDTLRNNEKL